MQKTLKPFILYEKPPFWRLFSFKKVELSIAFPLWARYDIGGLIASKPKEEGRLVRYIVNNGGRYKRARAYRLAAQIAALVD